MTALKSIMLATTSGIYCYAEVASFPGSPELGNEANAEADVQWRTHRGHEIGPPWQ